MKYKPLVASFCVIALFFGAMAIWRFSGNRPSGNSANTPANNGGDVISVDGEWKTVRLRELPSLDPEGLWPDHGTRVSDPNLWVGWRTREHASCRVIARTHTSSWFEVGATKAYTHNLKLDLSRFDDEAWFCVEWNEDGREYRSHERLVSFGRGPSFAQREYRFRAKPNDHLEVELLGELGGLNADAFFTSLFPENVACYTIPVLHQRKLMLGVADPAQIPAPACIGFLELRDPASGTRDRVLIELRP